MKTLRFSAVLFCTVLFLLGACSSTDPAVQEDSPPPEADEQETLMLNQLLKEEASQKFRITGVEVTTEELYFVDFGMINQLTLEPAIYAAVPEEGWTYLLVEYVIDGFSGSSLAVEAEDLLLIDGSGNRGHCFREAYPFRMESGESGIAWSVWGVFNLSSISGRIEDRMLFLLRTDSLDGAAIHFCKRVFPVDDSDGP